MWYVTLAQPICCGRRPNWGAGSSGTGEQGVGSREQGSTCEGIVFEWLKRRKMNEDTRQRLLVALAKSEEALVDTHVRNALDVIAAIGDELPLDRVLELYLEAAEPGEERIEIITRRVLARLEADDPDDLTRRRREDAGKRKGREVRTLRLAIVGRRVFAYSASFP